MREFLGIQHVQETVKMIHRHANPYKNSVDKYSSRVEGVKSRDFWQIRKVYEVIDIKDT